MIDANVKSVLIDKLRFTPVQLNNLENDPETLSKVLGLLQLVKQSPKNTDARLFAISKLKELRQSFRKPKFKTDDVMLKARSEYYTFH